MKKQLLSITLTLALILTIIPATLAATSLSNQQSAADKLNALGLFNGTSNGYELDRAPTRQEAITMLVRLLGKEEEAKSGTWNHPFTDVADWAAPYVGYAYANKLTSGISDIKFGSSQTVSATQYLTFVLRALGYSSGKDFSWDKAWELSDKIGLTHGEYGAGSAFLRGDVAVVSFGALGTENTAGEKLVEVLISNGALAVETAESLGIVEPAEVVVEPEPRQDKVITVKIGEYELEGVLHRGEEYISLGTAMRDIWDNGNERTYLADLGENDRLDFLLNETPVVTIYSFQSCFIDKDEDYKNNKASPFILIRGTRYIEVSWFINNVLNTLPSFKENGTVN